MAPTHRTTVREIAHDSPEYHAALVARDRILRQPLGLRLGPDDTRGEEVQRHFILETGDRATAGVIARAEAPRTVRLRQMWVEPGYQGRGHGRSLLEGILTILGNEGIAAVILHARAPVVGFYETCGFRVEGPSFSEVGIPHRRMTRKLSPGTRSPDSRR